VHATFNRVVPKTVASEDNTWALWCAWCEDLGINPNLQHVPWPLDFLVVFAIRIQRGELSKLGNQVNVSTVESYVRTVGARVSMLGEVPNPVYTSDGKTLQPRLRDLYKYLRREDKPATRVWPANLHVLRALAASTVPGDARSEAIRDLAIIAFYFLCRPGEYAYVPPDYRGRSTAFRLSDTCFTRQSATDGSRIPVPASTGSLHDVEEGDSVSLTFTDQKNAVRGECISLRQSGDPIFCPVRAAQRRALHLRDNRSPADTELYVYYHGGQAFVITTMDITTALRAAASTVESTTNIPARRIEARSLRSGGATALACAQQDTSLIRLIGRWRSDSMLLYLRAQADATTANLAAHMLNAGAYTFAPTTTDNSDLLPLQAPADLRASCTRNEALATL
jgi:hypothetical protein